ncbi:PREDICTED: TMV resistance protein N-like [Camelina sativa]|uniref:TMV resistance protein N-like n=1 Tax=Camelina sativa TaxID=90675 RepID=A0ABM0T263_CAMSA|nr:PREDICTED: TMV resistance protein N-like [Camelina sativa]
MRSGRNFPPRGHSWPLPSSATRAQRPSFLWARRRNLILNGGTPSSIRLPRPTKRSPEARAANVAAVIEDSVASYRSSSSADAAAISNGRRRLLDDDDDDDDDDDNDDDADECPSLPYPISPSTPISDSLLKYDVFISFRGPDARENFVSHLYDDLLREGIETFIDSVKLEAGDEIQPALSDAIEKSRISVVIFTKEYASSKWCLRELAKIMECRRTQGQIVLPVFLAVQPMEVRWQTGSYELAFSRHDEGSQSAEEVKGWRKAMSDAANLSGFDSDAVRPASKLVDEIVSDVLEKLKSICLCEDEGLVGAYSHVKEVEDLLKNGSDEVRTIGICGVGGIGKTAIAGAVFNRLHQQFDSYCFLANVREESEKRGLPSLRNELFRQILGQADINIAI